MAESGEPPRGRTLPVFPLSTVLFPGQMLPLHIFEQRYRQMVADCLQAAAPEFVVALIESGDEVVEGRGSPDRPAQVATPHAVGTIARIAQAGQFADGRYLLVCAGTERVRLRRLIAGAPYLQGEVEALEDQDEPGAAGNTGALAASVREALRQLLAEVTDALPKENDKRREQLSEAARTLPAEPAALAFFAARVLFTASEPEKQRLLEANSIERRLTLALRLLERERDLARRAGALASLPPPAQGMSPLSLN